MWFRAASPVVRCVIVRAARAGSHWRCLCFHRREHPASHADELDLDIALNREPYPVSSERGPPLNFASARHARSPCDNLPERVARRSFAFFPVPTGTARSASPNECRSCLSLRRIACYITVAARAIVQPIADQVPDFVPGTGATPGRQKLDDHAPASARILTRHIAVHSPPRRRVNRLRLPKAT